MNKLFAASAMFLALAAGSANAQPAVGGAPSAISQDVKSEKPAALREAFKTFREQTKGEREELKAVHKELAAILTAPTFDKAAYLAKQKEAQAIRTDLGNKRAVVFADAMAKLSPEERQTLAVHMQDRMKHHHNRMHDKGEHPKS